MATSSKPNSTEIKCVQGNEIINIGLGSTGVYMLNELYSTIMAEHKIDREGKFTGNWKHNNDTLLMLKHNIFFNNDEKTDRYIPRAIFMDCDNTTINKIRSSPLGALLYKDHLCSQSGYFDFYYDPQTGADSLIIWAKGHFTEGAGYIDTAVDIVRVECERCDYLQGFQFFHSLGGGWGSGFGTLLELKIRDNYPDRALFTYNIYPSTTKPIPHCASHHRSFMIYNTILSIHQILENTDFCYTFDNGKFMQYAMDKCKIQYPTYDDINWLLSQVISGCTSTLRFHAEPATNVTMTSYGVNFIPFPRLHFFAVSHSPFYGKKDYVYNENVNGIINDVLSNNDVTNVELEHGKMLNVTFAYRGNNEDAIAEMDEYILSVQSKMCDDFVQWIPGINVQSAFVYDGDNHCYDKYAPVIGNAIIATTAIKSVFRRMSVEFAKQYKRKAYLHWYRGEGTDEYEFQEAHKYVRDLVTEYQINRMQ